MKRISFVLLLLLCLPLYSLEEDFDILMGKNTSHWPNLQRKEDIAALAQFKTLYEKNKDLRFKISDQTKIPKTVHFIWLGPRPFPPQSVENVRTWIAHNPGWTFKFWTDRDRDPPCNGMKVSFVDAFRFQFLEDCYKDSQNWGEKSDILRYEILFQEGGVYVDHDANCLQPFEGLHAGYDFYCGLEAPHPPMVGHDITCGNGVIGSRPGHPVLKRILEIIGGRWDPLHAQFKGNDPFSKAELVLQRTYIALTKALEDTVDKDGNVDIVLPAAYFFAKSGISPIYSKHFFANAWAEEEGKKEPWEKDIEKALGKIKHKSDKVYLFGILILAVNSVGFILLLKKRKFQ